VRFLLLLLVMLPIACRPQGGSTPTGAADARSAVESFLRAARAQDLDAMSVIWGTERGPVRDEMERTERERRQLVMMCYLNHDRHQILSETQGEATRTLAVQLSRGSLSRTTNFVTVRGRDNRWYVQEAALQPLTDFCRTPSSATPTPPPPGTR
jgi:hypothetical protein